MFDIIPKINYDFAQYSPPINQMKKLSLFVADILVLYLTLGITLFIRYPNTYDQQLALHLPPFTVLFVLWIAVFYTNGLFDPQNLRNNLPFYTSLSRSIAVASALSIAFFYITPIVGITPRTNLFLFILIFTALSVASRAFFNSIIEKRFHKRTIIVGINPIAREFAQFLKSNPQLGYELKYIVDINPTTFLDTANEYQEFGIIQGIDNIEQVIREERISVVVLSPEAYRAQEIIDMFYKLLEYRVNFYNLPSIYERLTGRVPLDAINQVWFLENINESTKRVYEIFKRGADVILAVLLGLVTVALLPFIALAVKFSSPGPLFYRQQRVGRLGKLFEVIKFRSMVANDPRGGAEKDTGAVWTQEDDPRITAAGKFLRKTRLDELPQLWNVLKGEISFIGPRPERPEFHATLKQEIPFYEERYLIRPGLTGLSQLNLYGASVSDAARKLQYDLYYIKNRSLALDLGIFLKTLNLVIRGGGR